VTKRCGVARLTEDEEYTRLRIPLDFSSDGYKKRTARIRVLGLEGKGPMGWMQRWLAALNQRRAA
jgi:hypothetical protein